MFLECPNVVQVWRDVNLWESIDRVLHQNYNMDAVIFLSCNNLLLAKVNFLLVFYGVFERE